MTILCYAIVQAPHAVQQTMSREQTPVLSGAIPAFEMFMTQWERLGERIPRLKPFVDIGLSWATTYYARMDRTKAYILAMCMRITCPPSYCPHFVSSSHQPKCPADLDEETLGRSLFYECRDKDQGHSKETVCTMIGTLTMLIR